MLSDEALERYRQMSLSERLQLVLRMMDEELERSAKMHADTAKYLAFIANHLPKTETVTLTNAALHTLEILG